MSQANEIPTFAELTSHSGHSRVFLRGADRRRQRYGEIASARSSWLQHIDTECARLTAAYFKNNLWVKFDLTLVYDETHAKAAQQQHLDYLGICLLFNEAYEFNPANPRYMSETCLKDAIGDYIESVVRVKKYLAVCPKA